MFSFLNASMLPALTASLLPLLVHLIHRRRVPDLPFSNVAFLIALQEGRLRSFKVRQWLLLLLRTLAIFFLTLAFCRPTIGNNASSAQQVNAEGGRAIVLLLDRSYSLGYRLRGRRLFDAMVDRALELVKTMTVGDTIFLVGYSDHVEPLVNRWLGDPKTAENLLKRMELSSGATDIAPALQRAAELFKESVKVKKELYVFSDLAEHGWRSVEDSLVFNERGVSVFIVPFQNKHVRNASIDSVWVEEGVVIRGQPATIMARITNRGEEEIDGLLVQLTLNGTKSGVTTIRESVGETRNVIFPVSTTGRKTGLTGYVEVGDDDLMTDNRRYFSMGILDRLHVILAGDQRKDTRFLDDALRASFPQDGLQITSLLPQAVGGAQVVVLSNVRSLPIEQVEAIKTFLRRGGGVFICLGDAVDLRFYNEYLFPDILPVRLLSPISIPREREGFFTFDHFVLTHPIFNGLTRYQEELRRPRSRLIYRVEVPEEDVRALIRYTNGIPALCEARRGRGQVLFFNGSVDLAGGDFPVSGIFPPLFYRMIGYLASVSSPSTGYVVGASIERDIREDGTTAVLESPAGDRESLTVSEKEGYPVWRTGELTTPGIWRISGDGKIIDEFPVNVAVRESERGVIGETRLSRIFSGNRMRILPAEGSFDVRLDPAESQVRELWSVCLIAALVMFGLEMGVTYKKGK